MAAPLNKVNPGDSLQTPAESYNSFVDAAVANRLAGLGSGAGKNGPLVRQPSIVLIQNTTGNDLPAFSILGIDSPLISSDDDLEQFRGRVLLVGVTPTTADHTGKFVVTVQAIKNNGVGSAVIDGAVAVQVNITDPTSDQFADVDDQNTTNLISSDQGSARLIGIDPDADPGVQWAYVALQSGSGGSGGIKLVFLQNPTGPAGDLEHLPDLHYDVYDTDNTTLLYTNVGMLNAPGGGVRIVKAPIFPGTYGFLYVRTNNSPILLYANETYGADTCGDDAGIDVDDAAFALAF